MSDDISSAEKQSVTPLMEMNKLVTFTEQITATGV